MINRMRSTFLCRMAVSMAVLSFAAVLGAQTTAPPATTPAVPIPSWKTYTYPAEGFSASFPGEPQFAKKDVPTDKGSFELRSYMVEVGEAALFVGVCDYGTAISDRTPDQVLDGAQQGAIDNVKAHLVRGKKIMFGAYPGREFEADNDSMHFSARIYLVGSTLYQTLIAAPITQPYADVTRYLDSFQLIARVKN